MTLTDQRVKLGNTTYFLRPTKLKGCGGCLLKTKFRCPIQSFCSYISIDYRNYHCSRIERVTDSEEIK